MAGWKNLAAVLGFGVTSLMLSSEGNLSNNFDGSNSDLENQVVENSFEMPQSDGVETEIEKEVYGDGSKKIVSYAVENPSNSSRWGEDIYHRKDSTACECNDDNGNGFVNEVILTDNLSVKSSNGNTLIPASFHYEVEKFRFSKSDGKVRFEGYTPKIEFIDGHRPFVEGGSKTRAEADYSNLPEESLDRVKKAHQYCQSLYDSDEKNMDFVLNQHNKENYLEVKNIWGGNDGYYPLTQKSETNIHPMIFDEIYSGLKTLVVAR